MATGQWGMGDGMPTAAKSTLGPGDESIIVEHFICKICTTPPPSVIASHTDWLPRQSTWRTQCSQASPHSRSKTLRLRLDLPAQQRPVPAHVPRPRARNANLPGLLARPTLDLHHSNFHTAKAGSFNVNFMPLAGPRGRPEQPGDEQGGGEG
ncbi:hypothetical protein FIBSPDRAFT_870829 [Athelia psychrophila]|uniref:Uncharacterized protein n=1 Tax=Athelia psychrophila TaxID=1759441 RepID=A0A166ATK8_9AGAM|nr:hypothetical protein FIBSPDRAFT_870829 [Fibularhizoctonia sp. CBS 109695]